jgi:5S rRNA maturation endonuclease (ribonuclease M5)
MKIPSALIQNFFTSEFDVKKNSTGEFIIHSPFVNDKKGKLYIDPITGKWIDFKASGKRSIDVYQGGFLTFVKEYFGLSSNKEAILYLVENYDLKAPQELIKEEKEDLDNKKVLEEFIKKDKPKLFGNCENLGLFGKVAYKYVQDRDLDEYYYPTLGYVYNPSSTYHKRVIIPFFEEKKLVYFISRSIEKDAFLRYITPSKLDSKNYLFNIDNINEEVVLCEGTFDSMSLTRDQASTCLLSADISTKQLEKLFDKKVKKIIYVPDSDETGRIKMDKNISKILTYCPYTGLDIYVYNIPKPYKDLNELKIGTGKNYILYKECEKYGENLFSKKIF